MCHCLLYVDGCLQPIRAQIQVSIAISIQFRRFAGDIKVYAESLRTSEETEAKVIRRSVDLANRRIEECDAKIEDQSTIGCSGMFLQFGHPFSMRYHHRSHSQKSCQCNSKTSSCTSLASSQHHDPEHHPQSNESEMMRPQSNLRREDVLRGIFRPC